jgi:hypothetical protein
MLIISINHSYYAETVLRATMRLATNSQPIFTLFIGMNGDCHKVGHRTEQRNGTAQEPVIDSHRQSVGHRVLIVHAQKRSAIGCRYLQREAFELLAPLTRPRPAFCLLRWGPGPQHSTKTPPGTTPAEDLLLSCRQLGCWPIPGHGLSGTSRRVAGARVMLQLLTFRPILGPAMAEKPELRQVLDLLAASPHGCTKARLLADGFTVDMLADLVREGLATTQRGTVRVGGRQIRVERYLITDAGRRAIEG